MIEYFDRRTVCCVTFNRSSNHSESPLCNKNQYMENWTLCREILTIHLFENTFSDVPKRTTQSIWQGNKPSFSVVESKVHSMAPT